MATYDDKTPGIIESNGYFILPALDDNTDATFKASYIIASNFECSGKITALFNLIVLGNLKAAELDVKGRFICTGKCEVEGSIVVQNDIWVEDLRAKTIESHDRILVQEIDAEIIKADGNIIVGKILAVEELASSTQNILCGETAYGAGRISANTIITGEPLDLDDGKEALVEAFLYKPFNKNSAVAGKSEIDLVKRGLNEFAASNEYGRYIELLKSLKVDEVEKLKLDEWYSNLNEIGTVVKTGISSLRSIDVLIWITEIANSAYFKEWNKVTEWHEICRKHFEQLVSGEDTNFSNIPAKRLTQGNIVSHNRYGKGIVVKISDNEEKASIRFLEENSIKEFALPVALPHFEIIGNTNMSVEISNCNIETSIKCKIDSYSKWLRALEVLRRYESSFNKEVYKIAFDLIVSNLGLKTKFVSDRLNEKGWNTNGK
jgi:hypothetical protein